MNRKLIIILVGVGLAAIIVVATFLFLNSKPSPEDLAQRYINDNSGALAKEIADYMAANDWILERLDRDSFTEQVRRSINWEQFPARWLGGDMYEVRAIASVNIGVSSHWASGSASAIVPFVLTIDYDAQAVVKSEIDYPKAQFGTDLPPLDQVLHDIARKHINDKIDAISEEIVRFIVGGNWLLKELGGEYVEDKIHGVVKWEYQPSNLIGGDKYEVVSVAYVGFSVDIPSGTASVEVGLPFTLTIDLSAQVVEKMDPEFLNAYFKTDIPDVASIDVSVGDMVNFAKGAAGITQEVTESAKEALDESKEKAVDAAKDAIDSDCIEAAREAGAPENILDLIQKPKNERSGIDSSILRRGLNAVGLSEACSDVE